MNQYIDHTFLKQTTKAEDIAKLCEEAHANKFAAVCVPPTWVAQSKLILSALNNFQESDVKVCTVIGFPFGYSTTRTKVAEIIEALENNADEIDIVQNVSAVKCDEMDFINNEIYECLKAAYKNFKPGNSYPTIKVILESGILTDEEIIACCKVYSEYKDRNDGEFVPITFIKTSTGYAEKGASVHQVELIKANIPEGMQIKASGGIRNYAFAKQLIDAGATRLGCSSGVQIMNEYNGNVETKPSEKEQAY